MMSHLGSAPSTSCEVGVELFVLLLQGLSCPHRIAPLSPSLVLTKSLVLGDTSLCPLLGISYSILLKHKSARIFTEQNSRHGSLSSEACSISSG